MASAPGPAPGAGSAAVIAARLVQAAVGFVANLVTSAWGILVVLAGVVVGALRIGFGMVFTTDDPLHAVDGGRGGRRAPPDHRESPATFVID